METDFCIVDSNHLAVPVIIGADVSNRDGVAYIRNSSCQRVVRSEGITNSVIQVNSISLSDRVNTPVTGYNREQLLAVLDQYSEYFLSGTAITTVKNSEMHIKLTTNVPLYYRPYKLSHDEKLKVRSLVRDKERCSIKAFFKSPTLSMPVRSY